FQHNEVYVALTRTRIPGLLHWQLYVVEDPESGWRVHATTKNSDNFCFAKDNWRYLEDGISIAFVKIGQIGGESSVNKLVEYVKDIPMDIVPGNQKDSESKFSCRVWVKEAIRILDSIGVFVRCPDIGALVQEVNEQAAAAENQNPKNLPLSIYSQVASAWA
ncbi:hypothetical protein AN958_03610, partial [Leucoagaricus sp. SymC.cos]